MSSPKKITKSSPVEDNVAHSMFPPLPPSPILLHMLNCSANGEQDQGIPFKGPNPPEDDKSAISNAPDLEPSEVPKASMASALRRDSFKNIGQRRPSSSSNQPTVNLRRGTEFKAIGKKLTF